MIIEGFFKEVEDILLDSSKTLERFDTYDVYGFNVPE